MYQLKLLSNRTLNNDLEKKENYNLKAQNKQLQKNNIPKKIKTSQEKSKNHIFKNYSSYCTLKPKITIFHYSFHQSKLN